MIHQLMEAYGWTYPEAMKRTLPQITLLSHASWVSSERMKKRMDADQKTREKKQKEAEKNPVVFRGKTLDQMDSNEQLLYYGSWAEDGF